MHQLMHLRSHYIIIIIIIIIILLEPSLTAPSRRLEDKHKNLNERREAKKKDAQKKFKSMRAKWTENEKLVSMPTLVSLIGLL